MNVVAIHAKMEQHVPIMSIDFTVAVHQGTMECVVKMVRFPTLRACLYVKTKPAFHHFC